MIIWFFEVLIWYAVLYFVQLPIRKSEKKGIKFLAFFVKMNLMTLAAYLYFVVNSKITYNFAAELTALYMATAGDICGGIIDFVRRTVKKNESSFNPLFLVCVSVAACIFVFVYGVSNSGKIIEEKHQWQSPKLSKSYTVAFLSDMHVGSTQPFETVQKLVEDVNAANPDFILIGGDVTDEWTSYEELVKTYEILAGFNAPVYMVNGNHERQPGAYYVGGRTYTDDQLYEEIAKAGITLLSDEFAELNDEIVLLGREDETVPDRLPWEEIQNPYDKSKYLIVLDHQPFDEVQIDSGVCDLQLSGHIHACQLWPMKEIYMLSGQRCYGEYNEQDTKIYITAGTGNWLMPLRTEEHCEWDMITLTP